MFWRWIALALALWGAGMLYGMTFGGFIHLIPAAALGIIVARRMAKRPDTEFGRWRSYEERRDRR
jgi:hypothetical protein